MKYSEYSYRHGKELMTLSHPVEYREITSVLDSLDPFPHGEVKNKTPKGYIADELKALGWDLETKTFFSSGKKDYCDLSKNGVYIEQEYSRFEMFFRDFFRFLLLFDERKLDVGVIITLDRSAYERWGSGVNSYKAARASLSKVVDFLEGKYSAAVRVPIWCIGIE